MAKGHGYDAYDEMASLAWRMLEETPKTRIALPTAASEAAAAAGVLTRQQVAAGVSHRLAGGSSDNLDLVRVRPAKRVAEERPRRASVPSAHERRRRLQYAD